MWKDDLFCSGADRFPRCFVAEQACEILQGSPVLNAHKEGSVKADDFFLQLANLFPAECSATPLTWVL